MWTGFDTIIGSDKAEANKVITYTDKKVVVKF